MRLTLENWMNWTKDDNFPSDDLEREYRLIAQSEFLLENFFKLPPMARNRITNYARQKAPAFSDYAASLDMRYRMSLMDPSDLSIINPETFRWMSESSGIVCENVRRHVLINIRRNLPNHKEVEDAIVCLVRSQGQLSDYYTESFTSNINIVIYSLIALHGPQRMLEVMNAWSSLTEYHNLLEFISISDNWEIVKDYPMQWAFDMLKK